MAALKNRIRTNTTTTGTGTYTYAASPQTGYQNPPASINGQNVMYTAVMAGNWEVGIGVIDTTARTITRPSIFESSNSNLAVAWAAGTKDLFITIPAQAFPELSYAAGIFHRKYTGRITAQQGVNVLSGVGGTANAITASLLPTLSSYVDGQVFLFTPVSSNTSSAVTINIDALGARNILAPHGGLLPSDLIPGIPAEICYYGAGGYFYLLSSPQQHARSLIWNASSVNVSLQPGQSYFLNSSAGAITATLPAAAAVSRGTPIQVANIATGANNVTVDRNGNSIQGAAANLTLPPGGSVKLVWTGTPAVGWAIVASHGI